MEKEYKKVIDNLPTSWEELKFHQFKKLIEIPISDNNELDGIFNGVDNSLKALSSLTGLSVEELESTPLSVVNAMAEKIKFIAKEPDMKKFKSSIEWKSLKEISYDNYITFLTLTKTNPFENMDLLLPSFSKNKNLTEEEINNLPTSEILGGFFLLNRKLKKFFRCSIGKTSFQFLRLHLMKILEILFRRKTKE